MDYSDAQILKIVNNYKKAREREMNNYLNVKDTDEFKILNRQRAKKHYHSEKGKKKKELYYQQNNELLKCKSMLQYYKYNNRVDDMKTKYPEKCEYLRDNGIIF